VGGKAEKLENIEGGGELASSFPDILPEGN